MGQRFKKSRRFESLEPRCVLDSTVVFNELMFNPVGQESDEWIELHNQMSVDMDLSGWQLQGVDFEFPAGTRIPGRGYLVVAKDPQKLRAATRIDHLYGPFEGRLDNGGETLSLLNASGRVMDELAYDDRGLWPDAADGAGESLAKRAPLTASALPANWQASLEPFGTPGAINIPPFDPTPIESSFISAGEQWRYADDGAAPSDWWESDFDDTSWSEGDAALFAGTFTSIDPPDSAFVPTGHGIEIANPSFEANQHGDVGYGDIQDWGGNGQLGINPTLSNASPFADNGEIPDGRQIAFIQGRGSLTSVVTGLEVGRDYWFEMHYNARDCCGALPRLTASIQGQVLIAPTTVRPVEDGPYYVAQVRFTANATVGQLLIRNIESVGDHSLLIDAVSIRPYMGTVPILNGGFEATDSSGGFGSSIDQNRVAGWTAPTNGELRLAESPTVDGVVDGQRAIAIGQNGSLSQELRGLQAGSLYELSYVAASETPAIATFEVTIDDQVKLHEAVTAPTRSSVRFRASGPTAELRFANIDFAPIVLDNVVVRELNSPLMTEIDSEEPTQYFRRSFEFDGDADRVQLFLSTYFDDGAIVYLNGQEISRTNLDAGAVDHTTFASEAVSDPSWSEPVAVPATALRTGKNVIAVELHQSEPGDGDVPDVAFDLQLIGVELPRDPASRRRDLVISELPGERSPVGDRNLIEIRNVGAADVALSDFDLVVNGASVLLPEDSLSTNAHYVVSLASRLSDGDLVVLRDRLGGWVTDARHVAEHPTGLVASQGSAWFALDEGSFGTDNTATIEDGIVINEIMYHALPQFADDGVGATYEDNPRFGLDHVWRYNASGALPVGWQTERHEIGGDWSSGPGLLGFERGTVIDPGLNSELPDNNQTTFYFETDVEFTAEQLEQFDARRIRYAVDDGAVFYVNGQEVHRFNMGPGVIDSSRLAQRSVLNAELGDYVVIPNEVWRPGVNRISVEVHQSSARSSDVLFGAELFESTIIDPGVAPKSFAESGEEWVELFNRSQRTIDLSGWSFIEGFEFEFPVGTELAAGDYLVVANDPVALREKYPDARIVGGFSQSLANRGELVRLVDALGNPVDEVHYHDRGQWPSEADGGGSSLELIDARADNGVGANWAASERDSDWSTYTVTRFATSPAGLNTPSGFDELIFGLLDAGEVLIDDIELIEAPSGGNLSRLQNGDFESDVVGATPSAWRWIGNHQDARVEIDPDDPTNQVLRLVTTGPTGHMHNHGATTLADGAQIRAGEEYQLSFRAKWISGSAKLNSRLYFAEAAATSTLDTLTSAGTPGRANSRALANAGPQLSNLSHFPLVPGPSDEVDVFVAAHDVDGVADVVLHYSVDGGAFSTIPMSEGPAGFRATIPPQGRNDIVQFYVEATDTVGALTSFPAEAENSRALYRVDTGLDSTVQTLRLIMTRDDIVTLHENSNVMSNDRLGATVIYNDNEVFYDVGVRLRASGYGRQGALAGFNIQFDPAQMFRGVHRSIAIDRGAVLSNADGTGGVRGVPGASPHELMIYQIAHRAGDIPGMYDDVVYIDAPRGTNTGLALLKMARYSNVFLDSQFEDGGDGSLFKYELIYYANRTVDGDPESLKTAPNAVIGTDIQDLGDDAEAYRFNFIRKNHLDRDDYSGIQRLGRTLSATGAALDDLVPETMDIDQWARTFALESLVGVADSYNMGLAHNLELYVRPNDGKVLAFPWDVDHGFFYSTTSNILGRGNSNLAKVFARPKFRRLFYKHLLDIVENAYRPELVEPWARHYAEITNLDVGDQFINYVDRRSSYVLDQLDRVAPRVEFSLDQNEPVTVNASTYRLSGKGWIDVESVRLVDSEQILDLQWIDDESWQAVIPLRPGQQVVNLEAVNRRGLVVGMASLEITNEMTASPLQEFLRVSEVMYNPAAPTADELEVNSQFDDDDFEFVEIVNTAADMTIDLQGLQWVEGPSEPLVIASEQLLGPGEAAVLVGDATAFAARYGDAVVPVAQFSGSLSDGGETLRFEDANGALILEFTYDDEAPWPIEPDNGLGSLELTDLATPVQFLSQATRWQASAAINGSPASIGVNGDFNHDGRLDAADIDALCSAGDDLSFDLNGDQIVDGRDLRFLVLNLMGSQIGDANLDGVFDSSDLVAVFVVGQYEDDIPGNSSWTSGDWNCDGDFNSSDLVAAFQQ